MVLMEMEALRLKIGEFLNIVLFENSFFFFNLWSIIHFFAGAFIMFLIIKLGFKKNLYRFSVLAFLLIIWEILELSFGVPIFIPETKLDILLDLFFGMLGGLSVILVFYLNDTSQ